MSSRQVSLIVVSGPSGAGKSTALTRVLAEMERLRFSVSHTTRTPRPGEREGVDYHFVSRDAFEVLRQGGAFLEWATVHTELYGTCRDELARAQAEGVDLLLDLDVQGAAQVRAAFEDAVSVFVLPPNYEALQQRLRRRGEDEDSFRRRLRAAAEECSLYREYDYIVVNQDLDRTVADLEAIIRTARRRTRQMDHTARKIMQTFPREES